MRLVCQCGIAQFVAEEERGSRETVKKPGRLGNHDQPLSHYLGSDKENEKTCSMLDRVQHMSYSMLTIPVQRITLGTWLEFNYRQLT